MPAVMMAARMSAPVPDSPDRWLAGEIVNVYDPSAVLGHGQMPEGGAFVHLVISDRTPEEVSEYLESWNTVVSYASLQYDPNTDMRRVQVTNERVSASGKNGFTVDEVQAIADEWDGTIVSGDNTEFVMDAVLPPETFADFVRTVEEKALSRYYARRRWYITADGISAIVGAGGSLTRTAAQVGASGFLRDGLLD